MNRTFHIYLNISADEYLKLYKGQATQVSAQTVDGVNLRFPAHSLKPYLTHSGIEGYFSITTSADNRLLDIRKIEVKR